MNTFPPSTGLLPDVPLCTDTDGPYCTTNIHQHIPYASGQITADYPSSTCVFLDPTGSTLAWKVPKSMHVFRRGNTTLFVTDDRGRAGEQVRLVVNDQFAVGLGTPGPSTGNGVDRRFVVSRVDETIAKSTGPYDVYGACLEVADEQGWADETIFDHYRRFDRSWGKGRHLGFGKRTGSRPRSIRAADRAAPPPSVRSIPPE